MTHSFADHFSAGSADYARYRPDYPPALFDWLASLVPSRRLAWDCATGNGQAALGLAAHFESVVATDGSAAQLAAATPHPRVRYLRALAEHSGLRSQSADIVTVAQALHWFDLDAFYGEVGRVVVSGGAIAAWTYGLMIVDPQVDALVDELYRGTLTGYWPPERRLVDDAYRSIPFPFARLDAPELAMEREWPLPALLGYIGTWSAVRRYREARGDEALTAFAARMGECWGQPDRRRLVRWPLAILAGRIDGEVTT
jgi:hypothetical protein